MRKVTLVFCLFSVLMLSFSSAFAGRYYIPEVARWATPDPHAQNYPDTSPYAYTFNNPLKFVDPDGKDARVSISGNTITIRSDIYIYGSGASASIAQTMQTNIMNDWNNIGTGWQYSDQATGSTYNVVIDVRVSLYNANNPTDIPLLIPDSWNPFSTNNYIEVGATPNDVARSYVKLGDEGEWRGYGTDPSSHEFGHLIGLKDRYTGSQPNAGWVGNVMAEPAGQGVVQQKNIDAVVAPLVEQYKNANSPAVFKTKIDEAFPSK